MRRPVDINSPLAKQVLIAYRRNLGTGVSVEEAITLSAQEVLDHTSFPLHRRGALIQWMSYIVEEYMRQEFALLEDSLSLD